MDEILCVRIKSSDDENPGYCYYPMELIKAEEDGYRLICVDNGVAYLRKKVVERFDMDDDGIWRMK